MFDRRIPFLGPWDDDRCSIEEFASSVIDHPPIGHEGTNRFVIRGWDREFLGWLPEKSPATDPSLDFGVLDGTNGGIHPRGEAEGPSVSQPILCPHCQSVIAIKDTRPGRFRIKCPTCGHGIALTVPEEPAAPAVASIPETRARPKPAPAAVPDPDETAEQPVRTSGARPPVEEPATEEAEIPFRDPEPAFRPPRSLGGYRIKGPLATTRSGASFRAVRWPVGGQFSIAVVKPRWAADARYVARFAREAFATAQLRHPNLATVREIGVDRGFPFAVSDGSAGFPLSDPARGRAGLDRTARASAILHAGRALRLAHEQGVYHRGLTLDEIRVDGAGLVRLTGLGIGLTPETPEVPAIAAVDLAGGPGPHPPTAPEPPSATFARDDLAALGRALQTLIGGERGDRAVPPGLAGVARRMASAKHEPPFKDVGAAVRALEAELGVAGPFAPVDDQIVELEECVRAFDAPPMARVRPMITLGSAGIGGLLIGLALLLGKPQTAIGALAFGALTVWSLVKVRGLFGGGDPIFDRARELAMGGSRGDLLTVAAGVALVVGALLMTDLLGLWIFLGLIAGGLAAAYHFAVDRPIAQARHGAIERLGKLLLALRRRGADEDDIRRFVCRQSGPRWEEPFESAFGYDAMRSARARWGLDAGGKRRPRFAPWRDPIADFLDAKLDTRRRERDRALLQGTEERGAEARGINLLTARRKSHRVAEAMVTLARQYRRSADASVGLPLMNAMLRATERPEEFLAAAEAIEGPTGPPAWREALSMAARIVFGPRARFLVGGALLAGFLVWMHQNALIDAEEIRQNVLAATADSEQVVANAKKLGRKLAEDVQSVADAAKRTDDVEIPHLPPAIARRLDGFGLGVAGLILVLSSSFQGIRFAAFAVPGALVAVVGPRLIDPAARTLGMTSLSAMAIGVGLFAMGVVFGRSRD
jgi:eukaryotic-like serine/threonine-protein kinase